MAKKYSFIAFLLFVLITAHGQDNSDPRRADSMIRALKSRSGNDRIELLLNLAQHHIFKPGELQADLDSAMSYIKEATVLAGADKSSTVYGYRLLTESYLNREKGEREKGKKMAEEATRIFESGSNKAYLGKAYAELAMYYSNLNDSLETATRISLVQKSAAAFHEGGNLLQEAKNLELAGDLYIIVQKYDQAIPILNRALAAYESVKFPKTQGAYILLGDAYQKKQDYGPALHYVLKALRIAQQNNITSMQMCQINFILGILYSNIDRMDMVVKYLNDGLDIARKHDDGNAICLLSSNLSATYLDLQQGDKSLAILKSMPAHHVAGVGIFDKTQIQINYLRTFVFLRQLDNARPYCDTLLLVAGNVNVARTAFRSTIYRSVANYYFGTKEYPKVRYYLQMSDEVAKEQNIQNSIIRNLRLWYMLDSAQGNFQSAFKYLHVYKTKIDSVNSERKVRQFQTLAVEYQLGAKEDSIKLKDKDILLLRERNSLQQATLRQASIIKNVTIGGIILAAIIIGLLYRQYRNKQKSNRVITQKNDQLQHYLNEKEWLVKEIHHRVKNNLQIVMSLLNSQAIHIDNEPALAAIHDSKHRVHAMSLIHQKLYNADNLSSINISSYIRELVSYLSDSFNTRLRIHFELDIEPLEIDVSQAVPLGLIMNEAITNAIKYAFPDGRDGVISISFSSTSPHHYLLVVSDNGIGMPVGFSGRKQGSLGMSLMEGLSEDLAGKFSIGSNNGTTLKVSFVHEQSTWQQNALTPSLT